MESVTTQPRRPFRENGIAIRAARKLVNKSQERLAADVGTTRRHMIRLENGEHLPSGALRDRIVDATHAEQGSIQSSDDDDEDQSFAPVAIRRSSRAGACGGAA